ncbi:MAG TPA: FAD-binding oxidoreductase, partial [Anseongella sp.]|nr:FAD-binding oxidoreductase [Anseongella sp.]
MSGYLFLRIKQIIHETPEAATFVLENISGKKVPYKAGQFLTFIFNRHGKEARRSFSLSSAPGIDKHLSVTVKRLDNGEFSRYMLSSLNEGDVLKSLYPAGRFTFDETCKGPADVFLLAAGSGIVPVFSILKQILQTRPDLRVTLIYSNYSESSIIFREVLRKLEKAHSGFRCIHILSHPERQAADARQGHLNNRQLELLVRDHMRFPKERALFFICGPFTYMRM